RRDPRDLRRRQDGENFFLGHARCGGFSAHGPDPISNVRSVATRAPWRAPPADPAPRVLDFTGGSHDSLTDAAKGPASRWSDSCMQSVARISSWGGDRMTPVFVGADGLGDDATPSRGPAERPLRLVEAAIAREPRIGLIGLGAIGKKLFAWHI